MKKILWLLPVIFLFMECKQENVRYNLIVGTYTAPGDSEGIYTYSFNSEIGDAVQKAVAKNIINPSYLTLSEDNKFVYAVGEDAERSTVNAFNYDSKKNELSFINSQRAEGEDPCYIISDDKNVIVANYSGGSIGVFGIEANGALTPVKQLIKHSGRSITERQTSPHVHMVKFTPDNKYVLVNDLGKDKVFLYTYNPDGGDRVLVAKDSVDVQAGSGPRHLVFSKDGDFAYLLHELDGRVTVLTYKDEALKIIQESSVVAQDFKGENGGADIHVSPDGKFLYATNRGSENNISLFAIGNDGKIELKKQYSTLGKGPRNFVIDPSGNFLLVGHQYTNDVVIFKRDQVTGELTDSKKRIKVGAPVCLVFAPSK